MKITNTILEVSPADSAVDGTTSSLKHIVCCADKDIALCKAKISRKSAIIANGHNIPANTCVVCVDLWYESNYCPILKQCKLNRTGGSNDQSL